MAHRKSWMRKFPFALSSSLLSLFLSLSHPGQRNAAIRALMRSTGCSIRQHASESILFYVFSLASRISGVLPYAATLENKL